MLNITALPVFEHPLNERVRTFLRLEFLFRQARQGMQTPSPWGPRMAIEALLELLAILARGDVKSELIKELDGFLLLMQKLRQVESLDHERLDAVITNLQQHETVLQEFPGQPGQWLRDHDFLNAIRQRSAIPGGVCDFDLPGMYSWLQRPQAEQLSDLEEWFSELFQFDEAIKLALEILRGSAEEETLVAEKGNYHQQLNQSRNYQLLRITPTGSSEYFPEVSGGKHRFSIRFMVQPDRQARPNAVQEDVSFRLACCTI